jgi:DinB family protein
MSFSNPAGNATAAASGYVRALLDLLGPREPLEVLPELLPWLDRRLAGITDARLRRPEGPGKWSAVAIVQHLADSELILSVRARLILSEDRPPIRGFDQDLWAERFDYADASLELALAQLRVLREANLALWRRLGAAELAREGIHSERGPESLGRLLQLMAAHDLVHRRQIDRVLGAA